MRILRRIPVQYAQYDFTDADTNKLVKYLIPHDLTIENYVYVNKPYGGMETLDFIPDPILDDDGKIKNMKIVKYYPKKDVKLLLYDARYDNIAKNIPIYLSKDFDIDDSKQHEYTLDEMMKLFGKFTIDDKCVFDYNSASLDFKKLQAMGFDGVHAVNNNSALFKCWANGSTIWFNTKWIKSIESVDEPHNKIVPWKAGKENG